MNICPKTQNQSQCGQHLTPKPYERFKSLTERLLHVSRTTCARRRPGSPKRARGPRDLLEEPQELLLTMPRWVSLVTLPVAMFKAANKGADKTNLKDPEPSHHA